MPGKTDGPESIRAALELGAERIGHGIRAADDPELMRRLREEENTARSLHHQQCKDRGGLRRSGSTPFGPSSMPGVPITLNTDDPGVFDCSLTEEFAIAGRVFGFFHGGTCRYSGGRR